MPNFGTHKEEQLMKSNIKFISRESKTYIHGDKKDKWYYLLNYLKHILLSYINVCFVSYSVIGMLALYYETKQKELNIIEPYIISAIGIIFLVVCLLKELVNNEIELLHLILIAFIDSICICTASFVANNLNFEKQLEVLDIVMVLTLITILARKILNELIKKEIETAIKDNSIVEISFANCDTPVIEKEESE